MPDWPEHPRPSHRRPQETGLLQATQPHRARQPSSPCPLPDDDAAPGRRHGLLLPGAGCEPDRQHRRGNSPESNTASGVATAVAAGWAFKIETLDGDNVVTNLVAGETELTLRFTATYTVGTEDRSGLTSLWATFESGTLMSAVPSATPQEVGFGSGVDAAPTASARLSTPTPCPSVRRTPRRER